MTLTEQIELLSCPFCGGEVELEQTTFPVFDTIEGKRRGWGVVCRNTINLGGTCAIQQRHSATAAAAAKRWNTRAKSDQCRMEKLETALHDLLTSIAPLVANECTLPGLTAARRNAIALLSPPEGTPNVK